MRGPALRVVSAVAVASMLASLGSPLAAASEGAVAPVASGTALPLHDIAYRHDGAVALLVGGQPGQGVVLRYAGGEVGVARSDGHRYLAVAWHPSLPVALVAGDGALLRTADGVTFTALPLPQGVADFDGRFVAWKADGTEALVGGSALLRYVHATGAVDLVRASADEAYGAGAWKPDGSYALVEQAQRTASGWTSGRLLRYDGASLVHVATYGDGQGLVEGIGWAASGAWALVFGFDGGSGEGAVERWDGAALRPAFTKPEGRFTALSWRPGGTQALLSGAGGARLSRTDGTAFETLLGEGTDLTAVAWHPRGDQALLAGPGGLLLRWHPEGVPLVRLASPFPGSVVRGAFDVLVEAAPRAGSALQAVELRVDGGAWRPLTALDDAFWGGRVEVAGLAEGAHLLEARARDAAAESEVVKVQVRLLTGTPAAPGFQDPPGQDDDGVVRLDWTDTAADRYEVQAAREAGFAAPVVLYAGSASEAAVQLAGKGLHHLRVRGILAGVESPWSAAVAIEVTQTSSPFAPSREGSEGAQTAGTPDEDRSPAGEPSVRGAPGPAALLALTAAAGAALLARRRW